MTRPASVIVRTKDKAATLEATVASLRAQTVEVEIVVVDSGSTDGTLDLARRLCDVVVEIAPGRFSYGRSLNLGAAHASGATLFALSAHCVATDAGWVERSLAHYADRRVAGTAGLIWEPDGRPLVAPRPIVAADLAVDPHWGFSNHASSWRREAWEQAPFDETVETCEDKEWMWRMMLAGWRFVADPSVVVDSSHRRDAGLKALWRREYGEHRFIASHLDGPTYDLRRCLHSWLFEMPDASRWPRWARPFSPFRMVEHIAGYAGDRAGRRCRGPATLRLDALAAAAAEKGLVP